MKTKAPKKEGKKCPNCKGRGYRLSTSWVPYKSTTTVDCGRCKGTGRLPEEPNFLGEGI